LSRFKEYDLHTPIHNGNCCSAIVLFFSVAPPQPIRRKGGWSWKWQITSPSLEDLGSSLGFKGCMLGSLSFHDRRCKLWHVLALCITLIVVIGLMIFSYLEIWMTTHAIGLRIVFVISFIIVLAMTSRFVSKALAMYFIDSLCVSAILYVMCDLQRDDILTHSDFKIMLLYRIDYLAELTIGLTSRYAPHSDNKSWVRDLFGQMQLYVRERERWVIAPTDNILIDLKQDFYQLASYYITGNYGAFTPQSLFPSSADSEFNWKQSLITGVVRFVGIIIPLGLMGVYLWNPAFFSFVHTDSDIVALIFMVWLLLSIDTTMNLGVVAKLARIAKTVKDLAQ